MTDLAKPDPRTNAFRPDLADVGLQSVVKASRYVEPLFRKCVRGVLPLLAEPHAQARRISEIRYGEFLDVFEAREDGYAWVQNRSDRYVGYIYAVRGLSEEISSLSRRIKALHSFVYTAPDVKTPVLDRLTLGSYITITGEENGFVALASGGYVFAKHVAATEDAYDPDYVFTAGRLLGVPYLWGGRTPMGIDCSGLVQLALDMAGIEAPRDSDQQCEAFGQPLRDHWRDIVWQRGDLVFINPGHVGIMTSHDHIIHASGFDMRVVVEPLANLVRARGNWLEPGRP